MLKSKNVITVTNVESIYMGWRNQIEISDKDGNEVTIDLEDDMILGLSEKIGKKADEIRESRIEAARKQLEELNESESTDTDS